MKLPGHEVGENGFEVRPLDFSVLTKRASMAEAVHDDKDRLVGAIGHHRVWPGGFAHRRRSKVPKQQN
jgi:hypothetical protein